MDVGLELREEPDGALWFSCAWQLLVTGAPAWPNRDPGLGVPGHPT